MALQDFVGLYTVALNSAFVRAYEQVPEPPPITQALTEIGSKGRVENYPWLFPPPLAHQWRGFRQFAHLGETNYRVPNVTWTAEFECLLEDMEDDQINGFSLQAAAMARGIKEYSNLQVQVNLASGQTIPAFDGVNFFANRVSGVSGAVGTGNNIVTGTASSGDNVTHAMVVFITSNKMVKPLLWQLREPPKFRTNAGSLQSEEVRNVRWWSDMRGAPAFGFWWDAVLVKFASTPTITDMTTTLGNVNAAFRGFTYPKNLPSDINYYPQGQHSFNKNNTLIVCSSKIEHIARQALTLSLISTTENYYLGWANLCCSGYLDAVV